MSRYYLVRYDGATMYTNSDSVLSYTLRLGGWRRAGSQEYGRLRQSKKSRKAAKRKKMPKFIESSIQIDYSPECGVVHKCGRNCCLAAGHIGKHKCRHCSIWFSRNSARKATKHKKRNLQV